MTESQRRPSGAGDVQRRETDDVADARRERLERQKGHLRLNALRLLHLGTVETGRYEL